jgi:hypothetical protein
VKVSPFSSLLSACKSAVAELKAAMKGTMGKDSQKQILGTIFETGPQIGTEIPIYQEGGEFGPDMTTPFIVSSDMEKFKAFTTTVVVKEHLSEFSEIFQKNEKNIRKTQDGRAQCKSPDQVELLFRTRVKEAMAMATGGGGGGGPGFTYEATDLKSDLAKKDLADTLGSNSFAICAGCDTSGTERFLLPCLRMSVEGHRRVIMTPMSDLVAFMQTQGVAKECLYQVAGVKTFFSKLNMEQGTKYVAKAAAQAQAAAALALRATLLLPLLLLWGFKGYRDRGDLSPLATAIRFLTKR